MWFLCPQLKLYLQQSLDLMTLCFAMHSLSHDIHDLHPVIFTVQHMLLILKIQFPIYRSTTLIDIFVSRSPSLRLWHLSHWHAMSTAVHEWGERRASLAWQTTVFYVPHCRITFFCSCQMSRIASKTLWTSEKMKSESKSIARGKKIT